MFIDEWSENMVHHGLEHSGGIGESKEHDCWFKYTKWGFECCFPFVALLDSYIVVSPSDVKFSEDKRMDQIGDHLFNVW